MKKMMVFMRYELRDLLKNPAILIVIILPIFMSKVVTTAVSNSNMEFLLLSSWILFAQAMVGIMLTGPNFIEERESMTIDALLCSPLNFTQIVMAKSLTILLFSMLSQICVFIINEGFKNSLLLILIPMFLGGIVFVEIGIIIGLKISSSKNGSAASASIMIVLFLIVSIYKTMPEWTYKIFRLIPSIEVSELINHLLETGNFLMTETVLLLAWAIGLGLSVALIGRKY